MAEHARTLHYTRETQTEDARLFTTQGEVTGATVVEDADTEHAATFHTTAEDISCHMLGVNDGGATAYAGMMPVEENDGIDGLHAVKDGKRYVVTGDAQAVYGIALIQSGGGAGKWKRVDGAGNELRLFDFATAYPWSGIEQVNFDSITYMVKIPKFYVKYGTIPAGEYAGKKARWVSKEKLPGYHIHPAFVKNNYVMDCFYIGAYEGRGNPAYSYPNVLPSVNIGGFENAKTYCNNRNTDATDEAKRGYHLQNIYEVAAVNILMLIELGTPDVQAAIGNGNVSSSAAVKTGETNAVWRSIHEWWGNVWEHVDGLTTDANGIYQIFSNRGDGSYVSTGVTNPASGWITEMSEAKGTNFDLTDVFIPAAARNDTLGTYADYHWTGKSTVLRRGGGWNNGSPAGVFAFDVSIGASHSDNGIGLRLAKEGTVTEEVE